MKIAFISWMYLEVTALKLADERKLQEGRIRKLGRERRREGEKK